MMRTDLVVPAALVADVRMPPLAVTTGGADIEWVDVPIGRRPLRRRPAQRLPLDPRSARRARWYLRFEPWSSVARLVVFVLWFTAALHDPSMLGRPITLFLLSAAAMWGLAYLGGQLPRQSPYRTRDGDLRVPAVPIEVAKQWVELNPGVLPTVEPPPRPRSRRWYATWAVALLVLSVMVALLADDDWRWIAAPVLLLAGVIAALKTLPPGYIRFEQSR